MGLYPILMRNNLEHSELDSGHGVRVMMFNTTYNNISIIMAIYQFIFIKI